MNKYKISMFHYLFFLSFFSITFAYHPFIAHVAVNLSQASYCVSNMDNWNCITCDKANSLYVILDKDDERTLIGYNKQLDSLFFSFRGSSNLHNWIDNVQFSLISPYNNKSIEVEKGFYKIYSNIKNELFNNLFYLKDKYETNQILITGHSLGAAIATLLMYDIITIYPKQFNLLFYNFGSPRVGNQYFIDSIKNANIKLFRVTHYYDIVPHLPQEFLFFNHISREIWYNENNDKYIECNDSLKEDPFCSNSCSPFKCTSINDHLYYLNTPLGSSGWCF